MTRSVIVSSSVWLPSTYARSNDSGPRPKSTRDECPSRITTRFPNRLVLFMKRPLVPATSSAASWCSGDPWNVSTQTILDSGKDSKNQTALRPSHDPISRIFLGFLPSSVRVIPGIAPENQSLVKSIFRKSQQFFKFYSASKDRDVDLLCDGNPISYILYGSHQAQVYA